MNREIHLLSQRIKPINIALLDTEMVRNLSNVRIEVPPFTIPIRSKMIFRVDLKPLGEHDHHNH